MYRIVRLLLVISWCATKKLSLFQNNTVFVAVYVTSARAAVPPPRNDHRSSRKCSTRVDQSWLFRKNRILESLACSFSNIRRHSAKTDSHSNTSNSAVVAPSSQLLQSRSSTGSSITVENTNVVNNNELTTASTTNYSPVLTSPEKQNGGNGDDKDEQKRQQQLLLRPAYVRDLLKRHEEYMAKYNRTDNHNHHFDTYNNSTSLSSSSSVSTLPPPPPPPIIYYFGLGSNMLRTKLENRGSGFGTASNNNSSSSSSSSNSMNNNTTSTTIATEGSNATTTNTATTNTTLGNSTKIELISMEPGYIKNYRLSFNLRGFCPLEPGMGSLEPIAIESSSSNNNNSSSTISVPLHSYEEPECHGALVALTLDNYERVMRSEGIGPNVTNPGYEEIVVTVIPYNTSRDPVTAIALRAREHVRLRQDPSPSQRYMDILIQGAAELQLRSNYQTFLQTHPVQVTPKWLQRLAIYNLICTMSISTIFKWRGISKLQSYLLYKVYLPCGLPHIMNWQRTLSNVAMGSILFPCACIGKLIQYYCSYFNKPFSPMMQRFISMMDSQGSNTTNTNHDNNNNNNIPTLNHRTGLSTNTMTENKMKVSTATATI